jgi:hypothetical protein
VHCRQGKRLETIAKHPFLLNSPVEDAAGGGADNSLHPRQSGFVSESNFNPPPNFGGLILKILNVWLLVPIFFIRVVKIFAFPYYPPGRFHPLRRVKN